MSDPVEEELALHPEKKLVYSSPTIHARRRRVLKEARKMIAEHGLEGFSIRALCKQAGVAQRTLYYAFQNKDRIIALAIREAYEDVNRYMRYRTSADTLVGIIDRLIAVNRRNLKARNYTRAVTAIYFAPNISADVWNALREMVFTNLRQWLDRMVRDGEIQDWVDVDALASDIANIEYSTINDWAQGRLDDDRYIVRLITAVLSMTAGVTRGATHTEAIEMLRTIRTTGQVPEFPKPVYVPPADLDDDDRA